MVNLGIPGMISIQVKILPFGTIQITSGYGSETQILEKKNEDDHGYEFPADSVTSRTMVYEVPPLVIRAQ